jgi:Fe2+ transport system protein FeoA
MSRNQDWLNGSHAGCTGIDPQINIKLKSRFTQMTLRGRCLKIFVFRRRAAPKKTLSGPQTILDLAPGQPAYVTGFSPGLSPDQRALLRAYGLVPGYPIRIVQQAPVSVIQIEHAEIALENELAGEIFVSENSHL